MRLSTLLSITLTAAVANAQVASMPAHGTTLNGWTRGYYFTAPADFTITGMQVLLPPGVTNAFQNFAIVRFDNATPPPIFSATTNAFTQLALGLDLNQTVFQPVNVQVHTGDVIGIYGNTMAATGAATGTSSITATNPQATTMIGTNVVPLAPSGMQFHLGNATSPQGMHDIWATTAFQVSRVEFTYVLGAGGVGTSYCGPAVPNSTGSPATIAGTGSAVLASNDLGLVASGMPQNAFGVFLTSATQGSSAQPGGSQGVLCLGGSIGRYVGPGQIQNSGATGSFSLAVDNTQIPTPTGPVAATVGQTWSFQAWYRDANLGVTTSNFTDGLSVLFGNSPLPASGSIFWLRADAGVQSTAGSVSVWEDQSGQGNHAIMAIPARQPVLVTGAVNGMPVIHFGGAQSMNTMNWVSPTNFTIFIVGKNYGTGQFSMILGGGGNSPNNQVRWLGGDRVECIGLGNGMPFIISNIGSNLDYHELSLRYDGSVMTIYRDGLLISSHAFSTTGPWTFSNIGAYYSSYFMHGDLAELIIYPTALPEVDRIRTTLYHTLRYGL